MRVVVREESYNRAEWQTSRPLPWILVGLLSAVVFLVALVAFSPSVFRWQVGAGIAGLGLGIGAAVVLTIPLVDGGSIERTPDGGELRRTKTWVGRGAREVLSVDLRDVQAFEVETRSFEDGPVETHDLGRLWVVDGKGNRVSLTEWVEVPSVQALCDVLAKAGRR